MLHRRLRNIILTSAALILIGGSADAVVISYHFSGTGSGSVAGVPFSDAAFSIEAVGDTDDVYLLGTTAAVVDSLIGVISIEGFGVGSLAEAATVFTNQVTEVAGVATLSSGDIISLQNVAGMGLDSYDMVSSFGPLTSTEPFFNQFVDVGSSFGLITFSNMDSATFTATVVPEPAGALFGAIGCISLMSRRARGHRR
jgi:hypothetical protein